VRLVKVKGSGPKRGAGRPRGSGGPPEDVRRNRVTIMLTDAEMAKLQQMADEQDLPFGTVAYTIVARALARRK
jgi:hypothetical protein